MMAGMRTRRIVVIAIAIGLLAGCGRTRVVREYPHKGGRATASRTALPPVRVSKPKYGATAVVQRGQTVYRIATENGLTLVHVSSDYVFDGAADRPYREDDPLCPLGVYGQTKAAADAIVSTVPRHLIVRTSWVIGEGRNFVRTMASLAERGIDPDVVDDQVGRLTFTDELARGIRHLVTTAAPAGTYNLTQPEMSERLGRRKMDHIAATGADTVVTGNVGCILQITRQAKQRGSTVRVAHPIDLLDQAYRGPKAR